MSYSRFRSFVVRYGGKPGDRSAAPGRPLHHGCGAAAALRAGPQPSYGVPGITTCLTFLEALSFQEGEYASGPTGGGASL